MRRVSWCRTIDPQVFLNVCGVFSCGAGTISKLRHTVEEQQKALDAMAGMLLACNMNCYVCVMCVAGEVRRQEKLVRRVEAELEGARGAIAQSNARREELELQLRHEQQQQQQQHQQQQQQQQQQQLRLRIDELVRRCDDASCAVADAKAATAAALARAEEAEVQPRAAL